MSRRSFTLIELIISIVLTVIVVFFLYKALNMQEQANVSLQKKRDLLNESNEFFSLIYRDFKEANKSSIMSTFNKDYNILFFDTKNSLHDIPFSHVLYYVNAKDKTLVRLESASPIRLPLTPERVTFVFADVLMKEVKKFRVFPAKTLLKNKRELLPGEAPKKTQKNKKLFGYLFFIQTTAKNILFEVK